MLSKKPLKNKTKKTKKNKKNGVTAIDLPGQSKSSTPSMTEFKIVMLGAGGVGKSALTMQFVRGSFIENYDPTVEDLYTKSIEFNNKSYLLEILDTAGVEQFASMSDLYIRNGHGFILVYSITSSQSFKEIESLQQKICRIKAGLAGPEL